eukprot:jgi/Ulvmu1/2341/UM013_0189.1
MAMAAWCLFWTTGEGVVQGGIQVPIRDEKMARGVCGSLYRKRCSLLQPRSLQACVHALCMATSAGLVADGKLVPDGSKHAGKHAAAWSVVEGHVSEKHCGLLKRGFIGPRCCDRVR